MPNLQRLEVDESRYLPISGLQHLLFCERQCALIHVEQIFQENALTIQGQQLHTQVDLPGASQRPGVRVARALRLVSHRLRLTGIADVVEFHRSNGDERVYPVEYKRGKRAEWSHDDVQLCAQAMALEEMLDTEILEGSIFYGASKRRREVAFDLELRRVTGQAARRFHELMELKEVPRAERAPKCENCSLLEQCLPEVTGSSGMASSYLARLIKGSL